MSQSPVLKSKQREREPPPTLFLGPPSQNASHVSLPGITINPVPPVGTPSRAPLIRQRSQRQAATSRANLEGGPDVAGLSRPTLPHQQQADEERRQADRTDALWAEMQTTLEEVELSAVNEKHVFGEQHSKALEDLRSAQIALAQAWARSEAEDTNEVADQENKSKPSAFQGSENKVPIEGTDGAKSTVQGSSARPESSGMGAERSGSKLEEETEAHILLARRRREANDRYFQRVNAGVLDVVSKLEGVAVAMRAVEQESRDIWGDNESIIASTLSKE